MPKQNCNDELLKAQLHFQSNTERSIALAERLLRKIIRTELGDGQCVAEAQRLLDKISRKKSANIPSPTQQENNLINRWAEIDSINHPRLWQFLENLFAEDLCESPHVQNLRNNIIKRFSIWLSELLDGLRNEFNKEDVDFINDGINLIRRNSYYKLALEKEKLVLLEIEFSRDYQKTSVKINADLMEWKVDSARENRLSFDNIPKSFYPKLAILDQGISLVEQDRKNLEAILSSFSIQIAQDWQQLHLFTTKLNELQLFKVKSDFSIPPDWQIKVTEHIEKLLGNIQEFIRQHISGCNTLEELQIEYEQFKSLNISEEEMPLQERWFDSAQKNYISKLNSLLIQVNSKNSLEKIYQEIEEYTNTTSLPIWLIKWVQTIANQVFKLVNMWSQIEQGSEPISEIPDLSIHIPVELVKSHELYITDWNILEEVNCNLGPENKPDDSIFHKALLDISPINDHFPNHRFANELYKIAESGSLRYRLDEAIIHWDIERYIQLCKEQSATPSKVLMQYLQLVKYKKTLSKLQSLASVESYESIQQGLDWMDKWDATLCETKENNKLVSLDEVDLPVIVDNLIKNTYSKYLKLLYSKMDDLLVDESMNSGTLFECADALDLWQGDNKFSRYYRDFQQLAWKRGIQEEINVGNWNGAKSALMEFRQSGGEETEYEQLHTLLSLKESEEADPAKLADVLYDKWYALLPQLGGQQMEDVLFSCMMNNWRHNDEAHLAKLPRLMELGRRFPEIHWSDSFSLWMNWLDIEYELNQPKVDKNCLSALIKLVLLDKGRKLNELLREPLDRKITQWQQNDTNYLLYAWFKHAARNITPPLRSISDAVEPLDKIYHDTKELTANLDKSLRELPKLKHEKIQKYHLLLQADKENWDRLADYFNLLPFVPDFQPSVPKKLSELIQITVFLGQLNQQLLELEEVDLREASNKRTLTNAIGTVKKLDGYKMQAGLNARLETLSALQDINYPLNRLKDEIIRLSKCNKDEAGVLDSNELLPKMLNYLDDIIQIFDFRQMIGRGMWKAVAKDCWTWLKDDGKVLADMPDTLNLHDLKHFFYELHKEEQGLRTDLKNLDKAIEPIRPQIPSGVEPENSEDPKYAEFYIVLPKTAPRTKRGYCLFDREAIKHPTKILLTVKYRNYREDLPEWIAQYLENGIPFSNEGI
ncbi:hypothetical protein [Candidatus Venteria ishoeyi]|uniref:Uncharacterized protein n=1 Tax=Candidatus Venteria ishoeyi TaxID=1899563 RepID=A0A1H6F6F5_9GAMM|nr:hypothetical protein [Candidatus Venteria ishoeyi]SEH05748.1 Uncharacterised protein [Candidatus Venteria ishoeyi]